MKRCAQDIRVSATRNCFEAHFTVMIGCTSPALCSQGSGTSLQILNKCADIQAHISEGSTSFLFTVYKYMGVFMVSGPSSLCAGGPPESFVSVT